MSENQAIAKDEEQNPDDRPGPEELEEQIRQRLIEQIAAQIEETQEARKKQRQKRYEEAAQVLILFLSVVLLMLMILLISTIGVKRYQPAPSPERPKPTEPVSRDQYLHQNSGSASPQQDSIRPLERRK